MITFTTTNQSSSVSFLSSFQTGLKAGQKSTISTLARNASQDMRQTIQAATVADAALRTAVKKMQFSFNQSFSALTTLDGQPLQQHTQTITVVNYEESSNARLSLLGQRPDDGRLALLQDQSVASAAEGDANFTVDAAVENPDSPFDFSKQTEINLRQAAQLSKRLNLGSNVWGMESLARDLAVFGLDFTAMNENPESLLETVRERTLALLDQAAAVGGATAQRNQISGASARLANGIRSAFGMFLSVDSTVSATVDGKSVNASAVMAVANVVVDPLVLDLAGDGVNLSSAEEGVQFDMDGDGVKSQMGFIRGDDALLFVDTHGDGVVHDGTQLFGNTDGHANGFDNLQSHDDNNDGVIDKNDAIWDSLRVWVEKTADGVSEASETMTLEEAGVESINVGYRDVREDDGKGNLIGQVGSFRTTDGDDRLAADAWFQSI